MYKKLLDIIDCRRLWIYWIGVDKDDIFGTLFKFFDPFEFTYLFDLVPLFYFAEMIVRIACM
jgi:hypothetical protein